MDKNKTGIRFTPPHELSGLPESTPILLAFSGGADSRALLHLLSQYSNEHKAPLVAAHVNHKIRGEEALRDREFCIRTAAEYDIECEVLDADVPALARKHKTSLETEARLVRYSFFRSIMQKRGIPLLATAHNADDRLETLIFNIARGCGLRGLCSIPPVRPFGDGLIIRPLLCATKSDIIRYCEDNNLAYVTDSTNQKTDCSRNLIRHKIIPALEELNPNIRENSARLILAAREAREFIESEADKFLSRSSGDSIQVGELNSLPGAVRHCVLSKLYAAASGRELEEVHVHALSGLLQKGISGSALSLPGRIRAKIEGGCLKFTTDPRRRLMFESFAVPLAEGLNLLPSGAITLTTSGRQPAEFPRNLTFRESVRLLASGPLVARSLLPGDTVRYRGMTRKVRKLLWETGLPLCERYLLPVVCDSAGVLWIPGVALRDGTLTQEGGLQLTYYGGDKTPSKVDTDEQ
ncbi:MAG: tRNA lysidine(34) synthetase TilS [Eubacteriales bacterium]|jgi:tRNA(Ile)-lysidine synthase